MPMTREKHEQLLSELLQPELEHTRRTEILQELRTDYGSVLTDFDGLTQTRDKLEKENKDLVVSNSMLFRQVGVTNNTEKQKELEEKTFSETVTLEMLESQVQ